MHEHNHEHNENFMLEPKTRVIVAIIFFFIGFITQDNISIIATMLCYLWIGWDVLFDAIKNIFTAIKEKNFWYIFDEKFLMSIASIGAIFLHEYQEASAVMLFYQIGEFFQDNAVEKSRNSIKSMMNLRPDSVNVLIDDKIEKRSPDEIKIGDFFLVKPSERIPLDGLITNGSSMLDTSALTGESYPRRVTVGDEVLSGCINQSGSLTIRTTKLFKESTIEKILALVENSAERKAKTEAFITKFARIYTPIVTIAAVFLATIPSLIFDEPLSIWLYRALTFLVISCPCALVISVPLAFFGGIGGASKAGILVKGGTDIEKLSRVDSMIFDKTGTLTQGKFSITSIESTGDLDRQDILKFAALAEIYSNHPIAISIKKFFEESGGFLNPNVTSEVEEISGSGIRATVYNRKIIIGREHFLLENKVSFESVPVNWKIYDGICVAVDGKFAGTIKIEDALKSDAEKSIVELKNLGINQMVMLTGDQERVAESVARKLHLTEFHAELLPQDKVSIVEKILSERTSKNYLAFIGDGMNDAPVLSRADVGIAMGALGTDAAIEAADVVLMTDELFKIPQAIKISRKTMSIAKQNIIFAIGIKAVILILGAVGIASLWAAVFADVGVAMLAALNSMRTLSIE